MNPSLLTWPSPVQQRAASAQHLLLGGYSWGPHASDGRRDGGLQLKPEKNSLSLWSHSRTTCREINTLTNAQVERTLYLPQSVQYRSTQNKTLFTSESAADNVDSSLRLPETQFQSPECCLKPDLILSNGKNWRREPRPELHSFSPTTSIESV